MSSFQPFTDHLFMTSLTHAHSHLQFLSLIATILARHSEFCLKESHPAATLISRKIRFNRCCSVFCDVINMCWEERNQRVFADLVVQKEFILKQVEEVVRRRFDGMSVGNKNAEETLRILRSWACGFSLVPRVIQQLSWVPPSNNVLKINTDGSLAIQGAGFGFIGRDKVGLIHFAGWSNIEEEDIIKTEIQSILEAM